MEDQRDISDKQFLYSPPQNLNIPSPYHVNDIENPDSSLSNSENTNQRQIYIETSSNDLSMEESSENTEINPYFEKDDPDILAKVSKYQQNDYYQDYSAVEHDFPQYMKGKYNPSESIPFYQQPELLHIASSGNYNESVDDKTSNAVICLICLLSILFAPIGLIFLCIFKKNKKIFSPLRPCVVIGFGIVVFIIFVIISGSYIYDPHSH
ncbi:hypothetical protein TVAG_036740 [Trichomonas vaginalis G3]|uniref:Uncharacterized protein n=1 Tax=Trichomonas vaginalis (strain ATCC PRA-98 / G3) TaxID=412133 RepID=A2FXJ5_TRIV3|nr:hypothetical protein TVAGG3_0708060 [Trichomonas vaginalis G3]EAX90362.1 hypothetical protein TVAG_036740 [Trichomonas vaginalis G3]KAI5509695.1 hypothetical protein TVAGG3_0708060 [Trichomonas vaginalis G3]|eukprot:XP_001303292.1 hypothetical protein [Trichomonas vaginalis G3]